jgi:hypothetical protein
MLPACPGPLFSGIHGQVPQQPWYKFFAKQIELSVNHGHLAGTAFKMSDFDHAVFHAPYNKLVQKSFGRYFWQLFLQHPATSPYSVALQRFQAMAADVSYKDKELASTLMKISEGDYARKVAPSELITSLGPNV